MSRTRQLLAFLIAPAVTAACWVVLFAVLSTIGDDPNAGSTALFVAFWVGAVSYAHALVLGVPVATFLLRVGRLTLCNVAVASTLIGTIPYSVFSAYQELSDTTGSSAFNGVAQTIDGRLTAAGWLSHASTATILAASGLLTGIVWWFLARPSRWNAGYVPSNNSLERTREG